MRIVSKLLEINFLLKLTKKVIMTMVKKRSGGKRGKRPDEPRLEDFEI